MRSRMVEYRTERGNLVKYEPINERAVRVIIKAPTDDVTQQENEYRKITRVSVDELDIQQGTQLKPNKGGVRVPYKVAAIDIEKQSNSQRSYIAKTTRDNWSSRFIIPMLGPSRGYFRWPEHLVDVFVGDHTREDFNDPYNIMLLYRFSGEQTYIDLEEALKNDPYFLESYDPDRYHTMFAFQIPDEFHEDHEKFLQGRYSEMSPNLKKRIKEFHNAQDKSYISGVLDKADWRKQKIEEKYGIEIPEGNELASIPDLENREMYQEEYKHHEAIEDRRSGSTEGGSKQGGKKPSTTGEGPESNDGL